MAGSRFASHTFHTCHMSRPVLRIYLKISPRSCIYVFIVFADELLLDGLEIQNRRVGLSGRFTADTDIEHILTLCLAKLSRTSSALTSLPTAETSLPSAERTAPTALAAGTLTAGGGGALKS